ncbi:MAG: hypothetical protein IPG56_15295 [Caulobacteraceae bacterium]|nr:hypothetical protein [Caulobacteraceae bacterium]
MTSEIDRRRLMQSSLTLALLSGCASGAADDYASSEDPFERAFYYAFPLYNWPHPAKRTVPGRSTRAAQYDRASLAIARPHFAHGDGAQQ